MEIHSRKKKTKFSPADKEFVRNIFIARRKRLTHLFFLIFWPKFSILTLIYRDIKIISVAIIGSAIWLLVYFVFPTQPNVTIEDVNFQNITAYINPYGNASNFFSKVNLLFNVWKILLSIVFFFKKHYLLYKFTVAIDNPNFADIYIYEIHCMIYYRGNITVGSFDKYSEIILPYQSTVFF